MTYSPQIPDRAAARALRRAYRNRRRAHPDRTVMWLAFLVPPILVLIGVILGGFL